MNLFQALHAEWMDIAYSTVSRTSLAGWSETSPALNQFNDLDDLVRYANRRDHALESDRVLVPLSRRAGTDDLAARTLLQAMLPGIQSVARAYRSVIVAAMDDPSSLVIGVAYERIRTYPFERRPQRVAANVLLDTRQTLKRTIGRPRPRIESLDARMFELPDPRAVSDGACALDEAVSRQVLAPADAELIGLTRLDGYAISDIAAHLGESGQTLRQRRHRAEYKLRRELRPAASA